MKNLIFENPFNKTLISIIFYSSNVLFSYYLFFSLIENNQDQVKNFRELIIYSIMFFIFLSCGFKCKFKGFKILNGIVSTFFVIYQSVISYSIFYGLEINLYYLFVNLYNITAIICSLYVTYNCFFNKELNLDYLNKSDIKPIYSKLFKYYIYIIILTVGIVTIYDIKMLFF